MNTVDGYAISSWEQGYGDMEFVLDERTIRLLTHLPATAMVQCDLVWPDHSPVRPVAAQRSCSAQLDRLRRARAGRRWPAPSWSSSSSTRPTRQACRRGYRDLTPVNQYNVDYSILGTTRVEPLLRDIRNHMYAAGLDVEGAKGECNFGQHEIGFLYADALTTADNHAVYKTAAKEIAAQQGKSMTFMAKYNEREGNSCHIHLSLRGDGRRAGVLGRRHRRRGRRSTTTSSPACWPRCADFTLLYAPNINSYKRFADGSFAPTTIALGPGQPHLRGAAGRARRRAPGWRTGCPGGDVNPYLALAAMLAGGLHGIEQELALEAELVGNAYTSDAPQVPQHAARGPGARSPPRRSPAAALGDEVVDHYANMADVELAAFDAAVTDWELRRGFERL